MERIDVTTLWTVPRLWPGATVAVVASGPSLSCAQVRLLGMAQQQGRIRVIAVNDGIYPAFYADALYACDGRWWAKHSGVPGFHGLKIALDDTRRELDAYPDVKLMRNTGIEGLERDPTGLRTGRNSGYQAINLGAHLGSKRVLLVGFDMHPDEDGNAHYFGDHDDWLTNPTVFEQIMVKHFTQLGRELEALGIEVLNCTPGSALQVFPMKQLEAVLA